MVAPSCLPCLLELLTLIVHTAELFAKQLLQFTLKHIKGYQHFFQTFKGVSKEPSWWLKCHWAVPHRSPHIAILLPAQVPRTVPTSGTKSYFCSFPILSYDTAVKIHTGRQNIQPSPNQLPSAMTGSEVRLISFWKKRKRRSRTPNGCLTAGSWHTSNPRKGPPFQLKPVTTPALPPLQCFT